MPNGWNGSCLPCDSWPKHRTHAPTACSQSRGRQNEPAVAVDPRNTQVIVLTCTPDRYDGVKGAHRIDLN